MMDIRQTLTGIFRSTFFDDDLTLDDDMTAAEIPEWDSLSHINLVLAIEKGFGIHLSAREVRETRNIAGLISLISQKTTA